jgi:ribosomal protein S18 acetylase RimI-like enzyme
MMFEYHAMREDDIPEVSVLLLRLFEQYIAGDFLPHAQEGIRQYLAPQAMRARLGICHFALVCRAIPAREEKVQTVHQPDTDPKSAAPDARVDSVWEGDSLPRKLHKARIVGVIEVRQFRHISLLFVDDRFQRQGIARALVRHAVARCLSRRPDLRQITVRSSPYAVPIYERLGFLPDPDRDEPDSPALAMRLPLDATA